MLLSQSLADRVTELTSLFDMGTLHTFTINALVAPTLNAGESTFGRYFRPLFVELQDCSFIVEDWQPEGIHPQKKEILARHRVASLNIGRRSLHVYHGKRFLHSFGFAIPDGFGRVFAFTQTPDERTLRFSTCDGYEINDGKLVSQTVASFLAFEGAWTLATPELRLVEALRAGLYAGAILEKTPLSLRKLIGLE